MKEKKTKTFIVDSKAYKFDHSKFKEAYMFQLGQSRKGQKFSSRHDKKKQAKTEQSFREEMAAEICTSPDAIKKWRYGINSPGSIEIISDIEKYLQMEKGSLLLEDVSDKEIEIKKENATMTNRIIPDYERNAVRNVYQKLVECIEAFEETEGAQCFDESYGFPNIMSYENFLSIIFSVETAFHNNLMDIPKKIYDDLYKIYTTICYGPVDDDYHSEEVFDNYDFLDEGESWFSEYFKEYCNDKYEIKDVYDNFYVQMKCRHELVDGWYQEIREILKDYIPA